MTSVNAHFYNIKNEILDLLENAESSIQICMAWLTDNDLINKLFEKLDQGVEVQICLLDNKLNRIKFPKNYGSKLENLRNYWADLKTFQEKNGKLNIIPTHLGFIHHKFAVLDKTTVITGSYNWSINATKNKENIVIINDSEIAEQFLTQLDEIITSNHNDIISSNFRLCQHGNCLGRLLKVKLIDHRGTTKYNQSDTYIINFCTDDITHLSIYNENIETDYIGDLIHYEYDLIESELGDKNLKHRDSLINRRIEAKIAWSLDSRLDVFVDNNSHDLLGVYKITTDMEGFYELKAIWEHELIKVYYIESWENEIIDYIDNK